MSNASTFIRFFDIPVNRNWKPIKLPKSNVERVFGVRCFFFWYT